MGCNNNIRAYVDFIDVIGNNFVLGLKINNVVFLDILSMSWLPALSTWLPNILWRVMLGLASILCI